MFTNNSILYDFTPYFYFLLFASAIQSAVNTPLICDFFDGLNRLRHCH